MKIYQVISCGGQWEDYYEYVEGTFLKREKAQELVDELELEKKRLEKQYEKCQECPLSCWNCCEEPVKINNVDCEFSVIDYDEDEKSYFCMSDKQNYTEKIDESYKIEEFEVIE